MALVAFAASLARHPTVVGLVLGHGGQVAQGNGVLTFVSDGDGIVRHVPLVFRLGENTLPTLVSETLRVAQGVKHHPEKCRAGQRCGGSEDRRRQYPEYASGRGLGAYSPPVAARYVSPNRVSHLLENPEAMDLEGRRQECSFISAQATIYGEAFELLNRARPEAAQAFQMLADDYPNDPLVALHQRRLRQGESDEVIVLGRK